VTSANFLDDPNASAPYSKFSHEKAATVPVSGRLAMLLIYVPSAVFLSYYLLPFIQAYAAGELAGTILNLTNVTGKDHDLEYDCVFIRVTIVIIIFFLSQSRAVLFYLPHFFHQSLLFSPP
jgi:hypothetical protein